VTMASFCRLLCSLSCPSVLCTRCAGSQRPGQ
jgi:hypothetical protein